MATSSERELLEMLVKKMGESSALNGGFEKLCIMIEHIQEEQTKSGIKLDKVSEALYDPNNGLFSRVKAIESKLDTNIENLNRKVDNIPDVKDDVDDLKKFQAAVESIAGKQLEELNELVKLRKNLAHVYWALALSAAAAFLSMLFNLWKHTN
jgi:predicted  nucleic acid-binding Zn-ribbon protein